MVRTSDSLQTNRRWRTAHLLAGALLLAFVALAVFTASILASGRVRTELMRRTGATSTPEILTATLRAPVQRLLAFAAATAPPRLSLDVKFKYVHAMHEQREAALRTGILETSDADLVPGSLEVAGETVRARVRLAGDRVDLLEGEKWPLSIRTRGDDHVFGMRHFALHPPHRAASVSPTLFYRELRREDVIAPRADIVNFVWNGKPIGLMEYEEFPDTELLAHQQRRDSAIMRFGAKPRLGSGTGATAVAPLRPERSADSRSVRRNAKTAARLLQAYVRGDVAASEVFDRDLWARYLATVDAWGLESALRWRNLRFYLNPLTTLLEPVAYLGDDVSSAVEEFVPPDELRFVRSLLGDPRIAAAYEDARSRIEAETRTPEFAQRIQEIDERHLLWMHREYPMRVAFDVTSYFERPRSVPPTVDAPRRDPVTTRDDAAIPLAAPPIEAALTQNSFLSWHAAERELRIAAGRWDVNGSLILPAGVGLMIPAGTTLRFQAREGLIARGPLRFEGRPDAPVVLEGPAARKASKRWAGVYVMESQRPSRWTDVAVRNTGGWKRRGFELPGGVVFRKAPITMVRCSFRSDESEDALNMVRTRFDLTDVDIVDADLDAFDADYAAGTITGGSIDRARGDGIDLGGSKATVRGTRIANIRDKAISVGEYSELVAEDLEIERASIGIAAKNGSRATIRNSRMIDVSDIGLVTYTNQPEYGAGELVAHDIRYERTELTALAQTGSRLELDGRTVQPIEVAINRLYKDRKGDDR